QDIINQKYISLETYRKNNLPVQTPVWFVVYNDTIHIVTREKTGKIKRLKNNNNVQIAPCTFNGKITGKKITGKAVFSPPEDKQIVLKLRRKKYGVMEIIARFVSRKKGNLAVFSIKLDET
ncbi:MAG: PPOX class F420-dependent oxidoreductase, partial [Nitrosarchaeum sp.]